MYIQGGSERGREGERREWVKGGRKGYTAQLHIGDNVHYL